MRSITLPPTGSHELTTAATYADDVITVTLTGNADTRFYAAIDAVRSKVHGEALRSEVREVMLDLRKLEFMNSSCFKALVTWVTAIQELEPRQRYLLRFVSDPQILWQRRSLHALSRYASDLVVIQVT